MKYNVTFNGILTSPYLLLPLQGLRDAVLTIYSSEEKNLNKRCIGDWWEQVTFEDIKKLSQCKM